MGVRSSLMLAAVLAVSGCAHPASRYARNFVEWDARSDAENTAAEKCPDGYRLIAGRQGSSFDDYECLTLYGTSPPEVPTALIDGAVRQYRECLRLTERGPPGAREAMKPDPLSLPRIAAFARVIEFCRSDRSAAILSLRTAIQRRHPDWAAERVGEGAELAASRLELEMLKRQLAPEMTSHGPIEDY